MIRYFSNAQIPMAARAFNDAEKLVSRHFRMSEGDLRKNKYDVKTLAFLEEHEVKDGAFAHLCKYTPPVAVRQGVAGRVGATQCERRGTPAPGGAWLAPGRLYP